jgi:hypothetical protein
MDETKETSATPPREGATTDLPHDRITVERFRQAFPRARWSDRLNAWFVPGRTAQKRIGRWLAEQEAEADRFADEKGRDAFAFEPIESRYLEAAPATFQIRTPFTDRRQRDPGNSAFTLGCRSPPLDRALSVVRGIAAAMAGDRICGRTERTRGSTGAARGDQGHRRR